MSRFEYSIRDVPPSRLNNQDQVLVEINAFGAHGWELVAITECSEAFPTWRRFWWKRKMVDD